MGEGDKASVWLDLTAEAYHQHKDGTQQRMDSTWAPAVPTPDGDRASVAWVVTYVCPCGEMVTYEPIVQARHRAATGTDHEASWYHGPGPG